MKKITPSLLILAAVTVLAIPATAAPPIFQEDFSYALGSQLNGQGGWSAHSGAGTNPQTINVAGGLTYAGYPGSGVGNLLGTTATSGEDNNHGFTGQSAGAVYTAFMVNVVSSQTTGDYFFHYFDGLITANTFRGRVFVKKDASSSNYAFGIQFGSTINTVYTGFIYTPGSTHLLVLKYTFVAGGTTNDQVSLFVDPFQNCIEPAATVSASDGTQTDATNLDGVAIRQGSATAAPTVQVDGIRVATNWSDAVCGDATPARGTTWGRLKTLYR